MTLGHYCYFQWDTPTFIMQGSELNFLLCLIYSRVKVLGRSVLLALPYQVHKAIARKWKEQHCPTLLPKLGSRKNTASHKHCIYWGICL